MNILDLKAEIARRDLTVPKLAELIGMDKKTLYSRINGETTFKQTEIVKISQILNLTEDMIMSIFFCHVRMRCRCACRAMLHGGIRAGWLARVTAGNGHQHAA